MTPDRLAEIQGRPEAPFWAGLRVSEFRLPRCQSCGIWCWPAQFRCRGCGSFDFRWSQIDPVGHVFSWTRTWQVFAPERLGQVPYVVVVVVVPSAANSRVLGLLDDPRADVRIGSPVTGLIEVPESDAELPSLVWTLA